MKQMLEFRFASTMPGEVSVVNCLMMSMQVWFVSSWEDTIEKVNLSSLVSHDK